VDHMGRRVPKAKAYRYPTQDQAESGAKAYRALAAPQGCLDVEIQAVNR
jgi:hypothetical protein